MQDGKGGGIPKIIQNQAEWLVAHTGDQQGIGGEFRKIEAELTGRVGEFPVVLFLKSTEAKGTGSSLWASRTRP
jgi:hypothetical protein